jgi:hypothetical protein
METKLFEQRMHRAHSKFRAVREEETVLKVRAAEEHERNSQKKKSYWRKLMQSLPSLLFARSRKSNKNNKLAYSSFHSSGGNELA